MKKDAPHHAARYAQRDQHLEHQGNVIPYVMRTLHGQFRDYEGGWQVSSNLRVRLR